MLPSFKHVTIHYTDYKGLIPEMGTFILVADGAFFYECEFINPATRKPCFSNAQEFDAFLNRYQSNCTYYDIYTRNSGDFEILYTLCDKTAIPGRYTYKVFDAWWGGVNKLLEKICAQYHMLNARYNTVTLRWEHDNLLSAIRKSNTTVMNYDGYLSNLDERIDSYISFDDNNNRDLETYHRREKDVRKLAETFMNTIFRNLSNEICSWHGREEYPKKKPSYYLANTSITDATNWFKIATPKPDRSKVIAQLSCHLEEVQELLDALGLSGSLNDIRESIKSDKLVRERIIAMTTDKNTYREVIDALGDTMVTSIGLLNLLCSDPKEVLRIINISNFSKFEDGVVLRNIHGKIIKGSNYKEPDFSPHLDRWHEDYLNRIRNDSKS